MTNKVLYARKLIIMIWVGGWHKVDLASLNADRTKIEALIHISITLKRLPKLIHPKNLQEAL